MTRQRLLIGCALTPLALLAACGGSDGGGGVASTPTPTPSASPTPTPTPVPSSNFDTAEYRRSGAAVQAQALAAYNAGATGAGVTVGIIDSGVDTSSAEFAGRISSASADFAGSRGLNDEGGHGTAVADILLGAKNDSGIHGIAFSSTLLVLRTDTPGTCASGTLGSGQDGCKHNDNNIAAGLDAAVNARARVVNISLGGSPANARLRGSIDRATAAGTIIVISAGNDGSSNPDLLAQIATDPIARGLVIIGGAVDANSALADFSNKAGSGAAYYLTALGVRVRSVDQTGTAYLFSGTSFSAPVISGAVALLAQAFPNLTATQIVALLYRSANDLGATGVDATFGNGELNLARAFSPIGSLSLGSSAVPVSLSQNATLSGAMGDAAQGGLGAVVRDEFGRDFDADLSQTIQRTALARPLDAGLGIGARSMSAASGRASFAVAIDDRNTGRRLLLSSTDAERARVLAGAMSLVVSKDLRLGFGAGRGADGLVSGPNTRGEPAFLVIDRSLDRAPAGAFAMRRSFGGIGLTLAAEGGDMRLWQRSDLGPLADGVRRYAYTEVSAAVDAARGPFAITAKLTRLEERATVLGSRFSPALGGNGAVSWFADTMLSVEPGNGWRIAGHLRQGWTALGANAVRDVSTLLSRALAAEVSRSDVLSAGDSFGVRYAEPLRVTRGSLALSLPGVSSQLLSLAPSGHERDWEAVYARPLGAGWLTANLYLRQQPGNYRTAPNDVGAAFRYSVNF